MAIETRIIEVPAKRLLGVRARMSIAEDETSRIWRTLLSRQHEILGRIDDRRVSMRVYAENGLAMDRLFSPATEFDKWAAVEVGHSVTPPEGMEAYDLDGGLYAVFVHRGLPSQFPDTLRDFYGSWLPASGYRLDDREHFEVLPGDWSPTDPGAEEDVFVPVRR